MLVGHTMLNLSEAKRYWLKRGGNPAPYALRLEGLSQLREGTLALDVDFIAPPKDAKNLTFIRFEIETIRYSTNTMSSTYFAVQLADKETQYSDRIKHHKPEEVVHLHEPLDFKYSGEQTIK